MKLFVGLGNPGSQYAKTRHNAGYAVIDRLAGRFAPREAAKGRFNAVTIDATIGAERCLLMKPTTYMNNSGRSVGEAVAFYKLDPAADILVITDDINLPAGVIRMKPGGGTGGHNGLDDIQRVLGGESYPRLRLGVNPKPPYMDQADYVLGRFTEAELPLFEGAADKAASACEVFVSKGIEAAMNFANAPPPDPARPKKPRPADLPPPTPDGPASP